MKNNKNKVCHITTVHPRYDIRIFEKECKSLLKNYDVQLVVADGLGDETKDGIRITDVGVEINRIRRIVISPWRTYKKIKNANIKIIHLHDPELIPAGLLLKFCGKKIIFDVHEDLYEQIKTKDWIARILLPLLLQLVKIINRIITYNFNLIFAEVSYIKNYSTGKNKNQIEVLNYPRIEMLAPFININRTENGILYIGNITNLRGLDVILDALLILKKNKIDFTMHFVGILLEEIDWEHYKSIKNNVKFYGYLNIRKAYELSQQCKVGLAILKPVGNYIESIPTKIFEYIAVQLPYIASDFKVWKEYFSEKERGIFVNPENPLEVSDALAHSLTNRTVNQIDYRESKPIKQKFNWEGEEKKLLMLYDDILS